MYMMFGRPRRYVSNPVWRAPSTAILILHADHDRTPPPHRAHRGVLGPTPFASISAGIGSLWGPPHGGANEAVLEMLTEIGTEGNIPSDRPRKGRDRRASHGLGHRIYKNFDPRSRVIQAQAKKVLAHLGKDDPLLEIAMRLEEIALKDEYFIERKLYPNVDFYSGILLRAMGFPMNMFTAVFAVARTAGWSSHWLELQEESHGIDRPRQLYVRKTPRNYPKNK